MRMGCQLKAIPGPSEGTPPWEGHGERFREGNDNDTDDNGDGDNNDNMPSDDDLKVHGPGDGVDDGQETETLDDRQTAQEETPGGRGQILGGFHF